MEQLLNFLNSAIFGVIVGGLLSPITGMWIDKKKRKRELGTRLIEILYEYINYQKDIVKFQGFQHYYQGRSNARNEYSKTVTNEKDFEDHLKLVDEDNGISQKYEEWVKETNQIIIKFESQIQGLQLEAATYYGKKKGEKISALIDPEIDKSNNGYYFIPFRKFGTWTFEQFVNDDLSFTEEITQKGIEIQHDYNRIRKEIIDILL